MTKFCKALFVLAEVLLIAIVVKHLVLCFTDVESSTLHSAAAMAALAMGVALAHSFNIRELTYRADRIEDTADSRAGAIERSFDAIVDEQVDMKRGIRNNRERLNALESRLPYTGTRGSRPKARYRLCRRSK